MSNHDTLPSHVTGHVWLGYSADYDTPADLRLFGCDMSDCGYVMIGPIEISVDVPGGVDPVALQISALERRRDEERARSAFRVAEIDERLAKLAAITYQPEASA